MAYVYTLSTTKDAMYEYQQLSGDKFDVRRHPSFQFKEPTYKSQIIFLLLVLNDVVLDTPQTH
jgi:hypothetical protein